ncbi:MAG: hypothetical protein U0359_00495 [Byssovorax sp.]
MMRHAGIAVLSSGLFLWLWSGACTLSTRGIDDGESAGTFPATTTGAGGASTSGSTTGATGGAGGTGGAGTCFTTSDCPKPAACVSYACTAGSCVPTYAAEGTPAAGAPPGPCKKLVCDGQGTTKAADDDTQHPDDSNPCTIDGCAAGAPTHADAPNGTLCGGGLSCASGQCMGCTDPSQCPPGDTCKAATCTAGACGFETASKDGASCAAPPGFCFDESKCAGGLCTQQPKPPGLFDDGTTGNCQSSFCDGNGNLSQVNDDSDLPADQNANDCTVPACANGGPTTTQSPDGQSCGQPGQHCCDGNCQYGACCPAADKCGLDCCGQNEVCGNNNFCCTADKLCGGTCCDPSFNVTCLGGSVCCVNFKVCGSKCCGPLQSCVNGACL